jgi:hypothetical protein
VNKHLSVERREHNAQEPHLNRCGDWRPRLVIWPEYEGLSKDDFEVTKGMPLDDAIVQTWGLMLAKVLDQFVVETNQVIFAFERILPTLWQRLFQPSVAEATQWKRKDGFILDARYINLRQDQGHDCPVFLIAPRASTSLIPHELWAPVLDRSNLLLFGTAIADFGIEEAVFEISFAEHENTFLSILEQTSREFDHVLADAQKPFVSHWVSVRKNTQK